MHTFWLRLRDPPGGTTTFDSQRPSTTYLTITTSIAKRKISPGTGLEPAQRTATDQETQESTTAATAAA
ncbi:unnamed protein product [Acanthoscelides obtectus]|uniref:Uncharacterized protein n=1 Tax=Acanthoscelides obtectus TaxID=200917 RepID=A0A9P0K054_ACAOB|nr:unnamed protein product [Acanthoscelides obtectus]CAK1647285.1 hypothetical protein AOBTE_LOCUS15157 [Acanthoscelides obtectus]